MSPQVRDQTRKKGGWHNYPNALECLGGWTPNKIQTCGMYYLEGLRSIDPTNKTVNMYIVHETHSAKHEKKYIFVIPQKRKPIESSSAPCSLHISSLINKTGRQLPSSPKRTSNGPTFVSFSVC